MSANGTYAVNLLSIAANLIALSAASGQKNRCQLAMFPQPSE